MKQFWAYQNSPSGLFQTRHRIRSSNSKPHSLKSVSQYGGHCSFTWCVPLWPGTAAENKTTDDSSHSDLTNMADTDAGRCSATSTEMAKSNLRESTIGTDKSAG